MRRVPTCLVRSRCSFLSFVRKLDVFKSKLASNSTSLIEESHLSAATVHHVLTKLVHMGILREITGKKRNRVYVYEACLKLLNREFESTENER